MKIKLLAASAALAIAAGGGAMAAATTATAATTTGPASPTQIVLDYGGYHYCVNDFNRAATGPVDLWQCVTDPANNWQFYSDGTIRPQLHPGDALSADNHKVVLAPASSSNPSQQWSYHADGMLANASPTDAPSQVTSAVGFSEALNDPGYKAANGVQLITWGQPAATANAHWWVENARYGTTQVASLPDAGLNGGFWALDSGRYDQAIVPTGTGPSGYTYETSVQQAASFVTMPGTQQPNNTTDPAAKIGDVLTGTMGGWYTSTLTSPVQATTTPRATASGMSAWSQLGPAGFFPSGTTVTPGNKSAYFNYGSAIDNCGSVENMAQFDSGGKPDNSTGWTGLGNIPAYAPAGANYAGGQTCPAS